MINRERKSDSAWSHIRKTFILSQMTTDLTVVLKKDYRQTYRQTGRQKISLSSDRLYPFSLQNVFVK
jgi:hypothetical protein